MNGPTTIKGNRAAIADVYRDLENMIRRVAGGHARKYNLPFDEVLAEANLLFLEAYHSHDPAVGGLEERVGFIISRRLIGIARKEAKRDKILHRVELIDRGVKGQSKRKPVLGFDRVPCTWQRDPDPFEAHPIDECPIADVKVVVDEILDPTTELHAIAKAMETAGRKARKNAVAAYLRDQWHWDEWRIDRCFRAARHALTV